MAVITYPLLTVTDDSGAVVTGATVTVASVTDKAGSAVATPGTTVNLAGANVSVDYDAEAKGDAWVTLAISKVGVTFTGLNAAPAFFLSKDPSRLNAGINASGQMTPIATESIVQRTGTAQAGGASTITLDSSASATDDVYKGHTVSLVSGTGAPATRQVVGYVGSTKVATVQKPWATAPDSTTVYAVLKLIGPILDATMQPSLAAAYDAAKTAAAPGAAMTLTGAYDPAKTAAAAGAAMALTSGERTTLAGVILSDTTDTLGADIVAIKAKTDNLPADPASITQVNTRQAGNAAVILPTSAPSWYTAPNAGLIAGTIVSATATSVVVSGYPSGLVKGQHLYHQPSGQSRRISPNLSHTYSGGNYTFAFPASNETANDDTTGPFPTATAGQTVYLFQ